LKPRISVLETTHFRPANYGISLGGSEKMSLPFCKAVIFRGS
jgi:hypothetical protein